MQIRNILKDYNINDYYLYGEDMAKINPICKLGDGKVVLVTATNPTKYGEGKTTVAIGLNDALNKIDKSILCLREPSLGPVFGVKGGATGGGKAKVVPEDKINLHFTGDFHAITSANNLISAVIDNEIYHGNSLDIKEVVFKRCMDMNDRALRNVVINDGKHERKDSFVITSASEIMAVFCLATDELDLRNRIENIIIGYNSKKEPIYVRDLGIIDAVMSLLINAIEPNAVLSLEDNLALIHGGPFANIAHGCSSLISLETATNYAPYVVTEAGFGADAGALKFMDIVARDKDIDIQAIVLVTTIRALKHNGDGNLFNGIANLDAHVNNLRLMNNNIVVTLNKFDDDTEEDIKIIEEYCNNLGILFSLNQVYQSGGDGALDLASKVLSFEPSKINNLYDINDSLYNKIDIYARKIAHANNFICSDEVLEKIKLLDKYKYPICVAKTQYSISHNAKTLGNPTDYTLEVSDVAISNGAQFIIVYMGDILTMPGLSKDPSAKHFELKKNKIIFPK